MQNLGTLDGGSISAAYDINDSGQVVGSSNGGTSSGQEHAFLYSGGQMQDLGTLGGAFSRASGINDAGQVVGAAGTPTGNRRAFLYSGGQMKDLGTLDGGSSSVANDINNSGQVVGWSTKSNAESNAYPFLYSDGQMHDLNSLIPAGSGWQLFSAEAINSSGQIVGRGSLPGASGQRAFIATPDTPIKEDTIDPEIAINTRYRACPGIRHQAGGSGRRSETSRLQPRSAAPQPCPGGPLA